MRNDEKQAFEVMKIESAGNNMWKVGGRNYQNIQRGEVLYAYMNNETIVLPFVIVAILAFGKSLPELSYGYASELIIEGSNGEQLNPPLYLYKP